MNNILITGATGFIGKNLIERIQKDKSFHIYCLTLENDLQGISFLKQKGIDVIFENDLSTFTQDITYCVHLASYGVAYGARNIDSMIDVNIKLPEKIASFCFNHGCKLFINTGSCFEYGSPLTKEPIKEDSPLHPEDIYAASKVACEDFLKVYCNILGLKMITIRPFSIFGRYESLTRIGPLIINAGLNGQAIDLTGGEQIRDYMDVRDVVDAIYKIMLKNDCITNQECFNICSGNNISLKNFILMIASAFNFDKNLYLFGKKEYRKNESMFFVGDNTKLIRLIGNQKYKITEEKIVDSYKYLINKKVS